jgi:hypothetical protein
MLDGMKVFEMELLSPFLIPHGVAGFCRTPPVLRRGYPITVVNLTKHQDFGEEIVPETDSFYKAIKLAKKILEDLLEFPIRWEIVHSREAPDLCIFETCDNYEMERYVGRTRTNAEGGGVG